MPMITPHDAPARRVTLALPSFLSEVLLPKMAAISDCPLRAVAVPQAALGRSARAGALDLAVTIGGVADLPDTWSSSQVGELRHGLLAAASTAARLGNCPTADDVRSQPFVVATYLGAVDRTGEPLGFVAGDDRCPIGRADRRIGHEVETMRLASRVAAETGHFVYGPLIAAYPLLDGGALVEIPIPGFGQVDPLYLVHDPARLSSQQVDTFASTIRAILEELPAPSVGASGVVPVAGSSRPPPRARETR